jgi:hypothetical protein
VEGGFSTSLLLRGASSLFFLLLFILYLFLCLNHLCLPRKLCFLLFQRTLQHRLQSGGAAHSISFDLVSFFFFNLLLFYLLACVCVCFCGVCRTI